MTFKRLQDLQAHLQSHTEDDVRKEKQLRLAKCALVEKTKRMLKEVLQPTAQEKMPHLQDIELPPPPPPPPPAQPEDDLQTLISPEVFAALDEERKANVREANLWVAHKKKTMASQEAEERIQSI